MSSTELSRERVIARTSYVGIVVNAVLAVVKIVFGFIAGSLAVVGDGLDSASDILTSIITLITSRVMAQPPDRDHPYGHGRAEAIGSKIVAFVICFAGIQLFISAVKALFNPELQALPGVVLFCVTGVSIVAKIGLAVYKLSRGKKINSALLIADGKNMAGDVLISGGVLLGLFLSHLFNLPIIDPILALLVSLWILKVAYEVFMDGTEELMEGHGDSAEYASIFEVVESVPGAVNPHRCRIRKIGQFLVVDMDIEVDGGLSVREGHEIACAVERAIKASHPKVYDVLVHVEPEGNREDETYGLSPENLK